MPDLSPMQLQFTATEEAGGVRRLFVAGEVDMAVADQLADQVRALSGGTTELVLDLTDVTFMDSTGVGTLLRLHQEAHQDGWTLSIVASPTVWRVIELCALDQALNVRPARHPA